MNIEMANRLYEYRKKSGLSQEELADKLGISRQSVSKWERAEASPDTDNLIELAKIYGVSIDELLNNNVVRSNTTTETIKDINSEDDSTSDNIYENEQGEEVILFTNKFIVKNTITNESKKYDSDILYTKDKDNHKEKFDYKDFYNKQKETIDPTNKRVMNIVSGILLGMAVTSYLVLCLLNLASWDKYWVVFVAYLAIKSIVEAIFYKNIKYVSITMIVLFIYLTLGTYYSLWHPAWVIFLVIPIYYLIMKVFSKYTKLYYLDEDSIEHCFEVNNSRYIHHIITIKQK